jgi:hypothetical protein
MSFFAYFESKNNIVFNLRFSVIPRICQSSVGRQSCHSLYNIARSNEILGWEGVGNRQLLCFFKAQINWSMLTANLKFRGKKSFFFSFFAMFYTKIRIT